MPDLLNFIFIAAAATVFLRAGKYFDFRLGSNYIADLKRRSRLEKFWFGLANQSTDRLAFRVLHFVENTFSYFFGTRPTTFKAITRFVGFSILLNLTLAVSAIVITVPFQKLAGYVAAGTLPAVTVLLVLVNIPLDLAAYLFTRFAVRTAMKQSLLRIVLLMGAAVTISYLAAVLSTVIGAALTTFKLVDFETAISIIPSLVKNWIPLAVSKPFTSQMSLNGENVGYLAIGALPSIMVLASSLLFMLLLKTVAKFIHFEICMNLGCLLDDKKSFFEYLAMLLSVFLFVLWAALWVTFQLLHHLWL